MPLTRIECFLSIRYKDTVISLTFQAPHKSFNLLYIKMLHYIYNDAFLPTKGIKRKLSHSPRQVAMVKFAVQP